MFVCLGIFMVYLDTTVVNLALPAASGTLTYFGSPKSPMPEKP
jgi:hypothetical protein